MKLRLKSQQRGPEIGVYSHTSNFRKDGLLGGSKDAKEIFYGNLDGSVTNYVEEMGALKQQDFDARFDLVFHSFEHPENEVILLSKVVRIFSPFRQGIEPTE